MQTSKLPNVNKPVLGLQHIYIFNSINHTNFNYHYYSSYSSSRLGFKNFNHSSPISSFNNDVLNTYLVKGKETLDITRITAYNDDNISTDISAQLSLFYINKNKIKIPSKVEYVIRKYVSRKLLKEIHKDIDVAVEMCLLFTTQLNSTYFELLYDPKSKGWKSLKAEYLRDFLCLSPMTYKNVITALEHPLTKGAILECDYLSIIGEKNYYYRLGQAYIGKGIVSYELRTKEAKNLLNKHCFRTLSEAQDNPVCQNLITFYNDITLPTIDQIKKEGDRLIKLNYTTKKGKKLTKLNKHSRSYFKNPEKLSFVDDAIEIYQYLTDNGILIPTVGSEASGGRIVDSFTLMPSWIRSLVKVNGKLHVECDIICFHPNIAIQSYGGSKSYLTHGDIGLELGIDANLVKVEHLSFFNKEVWQMKESPLFEYYQKHEPQMLNTIITEKYKSEYKHKITSRRLFAKEVEVMTKVIQELNKEGIYVGYIYDALVCYPNHAQRLKEVMDEVILEYGIKTTAKLSSEKKHIIDECINVEANTINFSDSIKAMILKKSESGEKLNFVDANIIFGKDDTIKDRVIKIYDERNPQACYVTQSYILGSAHLS